MSLKLIMHAGIVKRLGTHSCHYFIVHLWLNIWNPRSLGWWIYHHIFNVSFFFSNYMSLNQRRCSSLKWLNSSLWGQEGFFFLFSPLMKFLIGLQDIVGLNGLQGNNCSWCGTHNGGAITSSGLPTASSWCIPKRKTYWKSRINRGNVKRLKSLLFGWWIWWIWSPCLFIAWGPWSSLVVFYQLYNFILLVVVVDHFAYFLVS